MSSGLTAPRGGCVGRIYRFTPTPYLELAYRLPTTVVLGNSYETAASYTTYAALEFNMDLQYQGYQTCPQGDAGVGIVIECVDQDGNQRCIQGATAMTVRILYPSGVIEDFTAVFLTDGSDGKMVYVTEAGDLDEVGHYVIQGVLTVEGVEHKTATSSIEVTESVAEPEPAP